MAKYYLEKGLKITRIYEFIQFHPEKCFEKLANEISDNRRATDIDTSKNIWGMTSKLIGNSLYSATLLNKEKQRNIKYCDNSTVNKAINNPRFVNLDVVAPGVYEVFEENYHQRSGSTDRSLCLFERETAFVVILLRVHEKVFGS